MLEMCPVTHLNCNHALGNLANAIRMRYEHRRHSRDIDECIELYRKALEICIASHLDCVPLLNNFIVTFIEGRRDLKDIDEIYSCTENY
jgi:hypothetical protein